MLFYQISKFSLFPLAQQEHQIRSSNHQNGQRRAQKVAARENADYWQPAEAAGGNVQDQRAHHAAKQTKYGLLQEKGQEHAAPSSAKAAEDGELHASGID